MQEMQETQVQSPGQEDPLEEEMATHSSILAWKASMDRGVWQAIVHGVAKSQTQLNVHAFSQLILVWPCSGRDKIKRGIRIDFSQEPRNCQRRVHCQVCIAPVSLTGAQDAIGFASYATLSSTMDSSHKWLFKFMLISITNREEEETPWGSCTRTDGGRGHHGNNVGQNAMPST